MHAREEASQHLEARRVKELEREVKELLQTKRDTKARQRAFA